MDQRTPSLLGLSLTDIFRPTAFGKYIAVARLPKVWLCGIAAIFLIVGVVAVIVVLDHTANTRLVFDTKGSGVNVEEIRRTPREAWQYLYGDHFMAGIGQIFLWLPLAIGLFVILSGWTHLIDAYRQGPVAHALGLALRVASVSLWPASFLTLICGVTGVLLGRMWLAFPDLVQFIGPPPWALVLMPGIPACGLVMASWTRRAIDGATSTISPIEKPPTCEGCGYDLSHRPTDGICPECGLSLDDSLLPQKRRPGIAWERQEGIDGWWKIVAEIVAAPRRIYGQLQLKSPVAAALRFARSQYVLIGAGAALWLIFVTVFLAPGRPNPAEVLFVPMIGGLWTAFIGWGLQRLLMALVFVDWMRRNALFDFGWARKVFYYESAYLWVFCLFNGLFATWMIATNGNGPTSFLQQTFGIRLTLWGLPVEPALLFTGNGLLCCLWAWRYYTALVAIRWSNQ